MNRVNTEGMRRNNKRSLVQYDHETKRDRLMSARIYVLNYRYYSNMNSGSLFISKRFNASINTSDSGV